MSDELYSLLAAVNTSSFVLDGSGAVTFWSAGMEQLTGRPSSEMLGQKAWTAFFWKAKATPADDALEQGFSEDAAFTVTKRGSNEARRVRFEARRVETAGSRFAVATLVELQASAAAVSGLAAELGRVATEAASGKLRVSVDGTRVDSELASLAADVNRTLDGYATALESCMTFLDALARGGTVHPIAPGFEGERARLAADSADVASALTFVRGSLAKAGRDVAAGDFSTRIDVDSLKGHWRELVSPIQHGIEVLSRESQSVVTALGELAEGKLMTGIESRRTGAYESALLSLRKVGAEWGKLQASIDALAGSLQEGRIAQRLDTRQVDGEFRRLMDSVNRAVDALATPLATTREFLSRVSGGDLKAEVPAVLKGELVPVRTQLNLIVASLSALSQVAERIAAGDLSSSLAARDAGDVATQSAVRMLDRLNDVLREASGLAERLALSASEIADASRELSEGATQQASALVEVSSTMTELAAQTKLNAENASQANGLSGEARESAMRGNDQMKAMVSAMAEIEDSGKRISKIIKVIDEIAFQTNLLALNAAVEAARAGQHGKGFAVVAEEVRNLAARSAKAAEETTDMIEGSIKAVVKGTEIAKRTADALQAIFGQVGRVSELVAEIASASREQAEGIEQTTKALNQIEGVNQRTTTNAAQGASASQTLTHVATQLTQSLGRFQLRANAGPTMAAGLPGTISPEMLAQIQQIMASRMAGAPDTSLVRSATVDPRSVISLDDSDFGKF